MPERILAQTKYLRFLDRNGWHFVDRPHTNGVVVIVAVTPERRILLVEQHRPALDGSTIELPAGLSGDSAEHADEPLENAARRELLEETGYEADSLEVIGDLASAPGLSSEMATFFRARGLRRIHGGGGLGGEENIIVHEAPLDDIDGWLAERRAAGARIAVKVYAGLWFARQA